MNTYFNRGYKAADEFLNEQHDGINPYPPNSDAFTEWEKGWQQRINESWQEYMEEQPEQNPQTTLDI
jgi:hypothetical protein